MIKLQKVNKSKLKQFIKVAQKNYTNKKID